MAIKRSAAKEPESSDTNPNKRKLTAVNKWSEIEWKTARALREKGFGWSDIANALDGRTENAVRKYFQKRIREEKKERELVDEPIQDDPHSEIVVASESRPVSELSPELLLSDDDIVPDENTPTELTPSEILADEYLSINEKLDLLKNAFTKSERKRWEMIGQAIGVSDKDWEVVMEKIGV